MSLLPARLQTRLLPVAARRRPHLLGELAIVLFLLFAYDHIRGLAGARVGEADRHGQDLLDVERHLHLDIEHGLNHALAAHRLLSDTAGWAYQLLWATAPLLLLGWCWLRRPADYRSARNTLVLLNAVALLIFFLWPVTPPRLLPHGGFSDSVALAGFGVRHEGKLPANEYAAMPSLHVGWTLFFSLLSYRLTTSRTLRVLAFALPALTAFVVVATANHYVADAVAGAVLCTVCALVCGLLGPGVRRRRPVAQENSSGVPGAGPPAGEPQQLTRTVTT